MCFRQIFTHWRGSAMQGEAPTTSTLSSCFQRVKRSRPSAAEWLVSFASLSFCLGGLSQTSKHQGT